MGYVLSNRARLHIGKTRLRKVAVDSIVPRPGHDGTGVTIGLVMAAANPTSDPSTVILELPLAEAYDLIGEVLAMIKCAAQKNGVGTEVFESSAPSFEEWSERKRQTPANEQWIALLQNRPNTD